MNYQKTIYLMQRIHRITPIVRLVLSLFVRATRIFITVNGSSTENDQLSAAIGKSFLAWHMECLRCCETTHTTIVCCVELS